MKKTSGFSLIELMIVVAVMGILVAIAYPSYTNSLIKGTRGAAKSYLLDIAQREQQYLLDNRGYASLTQLQTNGLATPTEVSNFYSTVAINVCPGGTGCVAGPPTFTATLTPITGKRQAKDGWLSINQAGAKNSQQVTNDWP